MHCFLTRFEDKNVTSLGYSWFNSTSFTEHIARVTTYIFQLILAFDHHTSVYFYKPLD